MSRFPTKSHVIIDGAFSEMVGSIAYNAGIRGGWLLNESMDWFGVVLGRIKGAPP